MTKDQQHQNSFTCFIRSQFSTHENELGRKNETSNKTNGLSDVELLWNGGAFFFSVWFDAAPLHIVCGEQNELFKISNDGRTELSCAPLALIRLMFAPI